MGRFANMPKIPATTPTENDPLALFFSKIALPVLVHFGGRIYHVRAPKSGGTLRNEVRQITILVGLVLFPFLFALGARFAPSPRVRSAFVLAAAVLTSLWGLGVACHGTGAGYISLPSSASTVALILELALGGFVLQVAWRLRAPAIGAAAATQLLLVLGEEFGPLHRGFDSFPAFYLDPLSLILALIVSLVGSLILLFALGYMETHEHHAPPTARSTGTFFFFSWDSWAP
jgi:ech hydrogenase subunit A